MSSSVLSDTVRSSPTTVTQRIGALEVAIDTLQLSRLTPKVWAPIAMRLASAAEATQQMKPVLKRLRTEMSASVLMQLEDTEGMFGEALANSLSMKFFDRKDGNRSNLRGARVIVWGEVLSFAEPVLAAARFLYNEGAADVAFLYFVSYDFTETKEELAASDLTLRSVVTVPALVAQMIDKGMIPVGDIGLIQEWLARPQGFFDKM